MVCISLSRKNKLGGHFVGFCVCVHACVSVRSLNAILKCFDYAVHNDNVEPMFRKKGNLVFPLS